MSIPGSFHQQYPVIAALSKALAERLKEAVFHDAYSLSKEELVMVFQLPSSFLTIKIIQRYRTCFLLFETYQPEKGSNAQACFTGIVENKVLGVEQHSGTRSFALQFAGGYQLVFKLYDALVNVVLYKDEEAVDLFRKSIAADWETSLADVAKGGEQQFSPASHFYIYKRAHTHPYYFSIEKTQDELIFQSENVIDALHEFSRLCLGYYHFGQLKQSAETRLHDELKKLSALVVRTREGLAQIEKTDHS